MQSDWSDVDNGLLDPSWYANGEPRDVFRRLRTEDPVHWAKPAGYGRPFWVVTRYQDVVDVLSDAANFSNYRDTRPPRHARRITTSELHASRDDANLNHMDPPLHTLFRQPMEPHFSPSAVASLESTIKHVVDDLLADVAQRGQTEFVGELAADIPTHVMMSFLGVPREDWEWLRLCVWQGFMPDDPRFAVEGQDPATTAHAAGRQIAEYTKRIALERRVRPASDFATVLTNMIVDEAALDDHEVSAWLSLLIAASLETTRNTASIGLWLFHQNPEQRKLLTDNPGLIGQAVDEVLRWASPVRSRLRVARFDTTIAGQEIDAGDWVVPFLSSANHDETVFENPHVFDILREQRPHVSLGHGIHRCIAEHLVKLELTTLFSKFLDTFPRFHVHHAERPKWIADHVLNGFSELQVDVYGPQPANS